MKKYNRKEILVTAGRWTLAAALASLTGLLSLKAFKSGKLCREYDRCGKCGDKSNCSLTAKVDRAGWKAK